MKKITSFLIGIAITVGSMAASWEFVTASSYMIDTSRITRNSDGTLTVWTRNILAPQIRKKLQNDLRSIGENVDFSRYSYSITEWVIDCRRNELASYRGYDYDKQGTVINSFTIDPRRNPLQPSVPGSEGEKIVLYVCR